MMNDKKKITVVIPNLNGMKYLEGCLESLRKQTWQGFETILIDNGSSDGSVEYVRSCFPEVRVRAYHRNTGFCHAVNDGILLAKTPYVLLLNNDTVLDEDLLKNLLSAMEEGGGKVFSCCSKLVSMKQPDQLDDAGDYMCALGWAFARGKGLSSSLYNTEEECFASCAAAALYRREIFGQIGLFDEKHFAYLEDIDIGWRAKRLGYRNLYVPAAIVYHAGSATSGSRYNDFKVRQAAGNSLYMNYKNMPLWQLALNAPMITAGILIKAVYFTKKGFGKAYLSGLARGIGLMRGVRPGSGAPVTEQMQIRMKNAGFCRKPSEEPKLSALIRIQIELFRGLLLLTKTRR